MYNNIDRTFGYRLLTKIGDKHYNELSDNEKFFLFQICEDFKKSYYNGHYLANFLCQYAWGTPSIGDLVWYRHIVEMIVNGTLYMGTHNPEHWAYLDREIDNNIKNLNNIGVNVSLDNKRNSDGLWSIDGSIILYRVYFNDKPDLDKMDKIELTNPSGVIEFGYQKICKTAMTLMMHDCLLRVPYNISTLGVPHCAIFYNKPNKPPKK